MLLFFPTWTPIPSLSNIPLVPCWSLSECSEPLFLELANSLAGPPSTLPSQWHFIYTEDTVIRRTCGCARMAQAMRMVRGRRSISNLIASQQGDSKTFIATFYLPQYSLLSPSSPTDHSRTTRACETRCKRGGGQ